MTFSRRGTLLLGHPVVFLMRNIFIDYCHFRRWFEDKTILDYLRQPPHVEIVCLAYVTLT